VIDTAVCPNGFKEADRRLETRSTRLGAVTLEKCADMALGGQYNRVPVPA